MLFLYRLTLELGYPSPDHLLDCLTSSQLAGWMAYAALEPFGEYRSELRHGQQMALQANINRDSKRKPEPYAPADFMSFVTEPPPPQHEPTPGEIEAKLERIFG